MLLMAPESLYSVRVYAHVLHDNRASFGGIAIASAGGRSQWNAKMDDVGALYDTIMFVTIPEISTVLVWLLVIMGLVMFPHLKFSLSKSLP